MQTSSQAGVAQSARLAVCQCLDVFFYFASSDSFRILIRESEQNIDFWAFSCPWLIEDEQPLIEIPKRSVDSEY